MVKNTCNKCTWLKYSCFDDLLHALYSVVRLRSNVDCECTLELVDDLLCDDVSSPPLGSHRQYSSGLSIPLIVCVCVCIYY